MGHGFKKGDKVKIVNSHEYNGVIGYVDKATPQECEIFTKQEWQITFSGKVRGKLQHDRDGVIISVIDPKHQLEKVKDIKSLYYIHHRDFDRFTDFSKSEDFIKQSIFINFNNPNYQCNIDLPSHKHKQVEIIHNYKEELPQLTVLIEYRGKTWNNEKLEAEVEEDKNYIIKQVETTLNSLIEKDQIVKNLNEKFKI